MNGLMIRNKKAFQLQAALAQEFGEELIELDTRHHFGGGVYVREVCLVAGTCLVGKMHRAETMNMLVSGTMALVTEDEPLEVTGPYIFTTPPMNKKAAYCLTDCIFITMHPTEKTEPEDVVEEFTVPESEAAEFMKLLEDES